MKNNNNISSEQVRMSSAVYCVIFCNGIATNYALDTIDYVNSQEHKFAKGVYKTLSTIEKKFSEVDSVLKSRIGNAETYSFMFDISNVNYKELNSDLNKFENAIKLYLDKKKVIHSDVVAKVYATSILTDFAVDIVDKIIADFGNDFKVENSIFYARKTFEPLKLRSASVMVTKLKGMLCNSNTLGFMSDDNCILGYKIISDKLVRPEFYRSVLSQAQDLQKGISKSDRAAMNEKEQMDKLKEHFNPKRCNYGN